MLSSSVLLICCCVGRAWQDVHGAKYTGMLDVFRRVYAENGLRSLFAGVVPRMTWISIGGFVFFGVYEKAKRVIASIA